MQILINILALTLTIGAIFLSADWFRPLGLSLFSEQYLAGLLAVSLALVFLVVPANQGEGWKKREGNVPWYDLIAALVSFAAVAYLTVRFPKLSELVSRRPMDGMVCAVLVVVSVLEGLRRTTGMWLFVITIGFFVLAMFGGQLPGEFAARSIPADRLTYYLVWDSTGITGLTLKIVATVVIVYVLFGNVLFRAGGSVFFTNMPCH